MAYTHTWNTSFEGVPASTDDASEGALRIRNFKEAIRERVQHDHYMDPAGTDSDHGEHKQITLRTGAYGGTGEANKGIVHAKDVNAVAELFYYDESGNDIQLTVGGLIVGLIPSGTKMFFKESSAPTGWIFVSEDNDRALINTSTEADGGTTGGTWQQDGHTLVESEIPSHTHTGSSGTSGSHSHNLPTVDSNETGTSDGFDYQTSVGSITDESTYSSGSHSHSISVGSTGGDGTHDHGSSWRPAFVKVITCQKN